MLSFNTDHRIVVQYRFFIKAVLLYLYINTNLVQNLLYRVVLVNIQPTSYGALHTNINGNYNPLIFHTTYVVFINFYS